MSVTYNITEAINQKKVIRFRYHGHVRIVEPHLLGVKTTGNVVLSAWQVGGYSETGHIPPWRNYIISDIAAIENTGETFNSHRPGYNRNDRTMVRIIARV